MNEEKDVVKATFELYGQYGFTSEEIASFFNGKSIYKIIEERIYNLYIQILEISEETSLNVFEDLKVEKVLKSKNDVEKQIIIPLQESKSQISNIDTSDKDYYFKKIDSIIDLIRKKDEILSKYENLIKSLKEKRKEKVKGVRNLSDNLYIGKKNKEREI